MLSKKIVSLRKKNNLTQEKLAEKMGVSRQTIYKWETGVVNPTLEYISQLADLFNVSYDFLLNDDVDWLEPVNVAPLAICSKCQKKIYDTSFVNITYKNNHHNEFIPFETLCNDCYEKKKRESEERKMEYSNYKKRFAWSYFLGAIPLIVLSILLIVTNEFNWDKIPGLLIICLPAFTLVGCCFAKNNFVEEVIFFGVGAKTISWPGLIFELDLDGILWFIAVKLIFGLITIIFSIVVSAIVLVFAMICSVFVYPYAVYNVYAHPDKAC